jgi:hypothetical protein
MKAAGAISNLDPSTVDPFGQRQPDNFHDPRKLSLNTLDRVTNILSAFEVPDLDCWRPFIEPIWQRWSMFIPTKPMLRNG